MSTMVAVSSPMRSSSQLPISTWDSWLIALREPRAAIKLVATDPIIKPMVFSPTRGASGRKIGPEADRSLESWNF